MIEFDKIDIDSSWKPIVNAEFDKPYFREIVNGINSSLVVGSVVYPPVSQMFSAFNFTSFDRVRVVILGQDPYHGPGQAMGLCFSVNRGVKVPRSLNRIYKELASDVGINIPNHGDLSEWAKQGVFMPNAMLTVEAGRPASHAKIGWQKFTDAIIKKISDEKTGVCFLLWGGFAKSKKKLIDITKHHIFESAHPSPLAGNAFFGNNHFSGTNKILRSRGEQPINWQI